MDGEAMKPDVDVLVVGAGPAGLASAIVLARQGRRVLVCEKGSLPQDKPCGEGVMPTGLAVLRRLGAEPAVSRSYCGIGYHSPRGVVARTRITEGPGRGVRRTELSRALLSALPPEVDVEEGSPLQEMDLRERCVRVGGRRLTASLIVGADGLRSRTRVLAGLDRTPLPRFQRWGARQHFFVPPWSDHVEVFFSSGLEAYVTPVSDEAVGVAVLWHRHRLRPGGGERLMTSLLQPFPELSERLSGADAASRVRAVGPLHHGARTCAVPGLALVGDASGYLDAATGEGISLALAQAEALGTAVAQGDLQAYRRSHARIVAGYYRMTWLLLALSRSPWITERFCLGLRQEPTAFSYLLSLSLGTADWRTLPSRAALRLLARLVRG